MKTTMIGSLTALTLVAMSHVAGAQDSMAKPMEMGKDKTYTGCIEAGAMANGFALTHVGAGMPPMAKDAMAKDTMTKDAMGKGGMEMASWTLSSKSVDFSKHVGHLVSVTGTEDTMATDTMGKGQHTFNVTSLKMVAATCGK